jgi:hypothetical protein
MGSGSWSASGTACGAGRSRCPAWEPEHAQEAFVFSVSCASPGDCAAGGGYADRRGQQGFVAVERNGRWANAIEVPGLRALNVGASAAVFSVSCAPAGSCAAGGGYSDRHCRSQGFVVSQTG